MELFSLYASIGLKDQGFSKGISDAKDKASGLTGGIKNLVGTVAGVKVLSMAFDAVKGSVDAAFKRIDTMEQFSRTMTVLSGSSEKASVVLETVRQSVIGTAYGLDIAANSVQNFVTSGMDIDVAATHIEGLANAVSFYGDGTNATLQSVSYAWGKMATSGKVYSTDVRSLILAGIPVWDIYAQAVGMSVEEVQEATSSGTIKAEEFQNTLIQALETGAGKFPSVSNAAKEAGTSWAGTFDNMKAATTRGVMGIIQSIDGGLTGSSLPDLRSMLMTVARGFETFLGSVANAAKELAQSLAPAISVGMNLFNIAIPVLGSAVEVMAKLAPAIVAVTVAYGAVQAVNTFKTAMVASTLAVEAAKFAQDNYTYSKAAGTAAEDLAAIMSSKSAASEAVRTAAKQAGLTVEKEKILVTAAGTLATDAEALAVLRSSSAMSVKTAVLGLLAGGTARATAAQWLLNAAQMAMPVVAVVAGIAALVAGLIALVKWVGSNETEADKLKKKYEELGSEIDATADAIAENTKKHKNAIKQIEAEGTATGALVDKIADLAKNTKKTAQEKALLSNYVKQLNGNVDGLNLAYDAEADALSETIDLVKEKTATYSGQETLAAQQERLNEILFEQAQLQQQQNDIFDERGDWEAKYQAEEVSLLDYGYAMTEFGEREAQVAEETAALAEEQVALEAAVGSALAEAAESVEAYAEKVVEMSEYQKESLDILADEYGSLKDAASDMFSSISEESEYTIDEMIANLEHNQQMIEQWSDNIALLAERGIDDGLLEQLRTAGPESAALVQELVNASDEELGKLSDVYGDAGEVAVRALATSTGQSSDVVRAAQTIADSSSDSLKARLEKANFSGIGMDVVRGYAKGIQDNAAMAGTAGEEIAQESIDGTKDILDSNSPSKVYIDIGGDVVDGFAKGITDNVKTAVDAIKKLITDVTTSAVESVKKSITDIKAAAEKQVTASNFNTVGENMMKGIEKGIVAGKSGVISAMVKAIQDAHAAAKQADQQASPSKWWIQFAKNEMEGWSIGVKNNVDMVTDEYDDAISTVQGIASAPLNVGGLTGKAKSRFGSGMTPALAGAGGVTIVQNMQQAPSTPYEQHLHARALYEQARWRA